MGVKMADQTNEIEKLATKIKDALGTAVFDGETGDQTPESAKWEQVWKAASNGARRPRGEALDKIAQDVAPKVAERGDAPMSDDDMTEIVKTAYQAAAPAGEAPKAETITLGSPTPMDKKIDLSQGTAIDVTPVVTVKAIEPAETAADAAAPTPKPEGWTDAQIDAAGNTLTRGNPSQRPDYTPPEARGTLPVLAAAQPEPAAVIACR